MKGFKNIIRRLIFKIIFRNIHVYKLLILFARYTSFLLPHEEDIHGLSYLSLNKKKIIVDVGASDGLFYKSIRHIGIKNKLYAFEPLKENLKYLRQISKKDKNFKYESVALGNKKSHFFIYTPFYKGKYINNLSSFSKKECKENIKVINFNIDLKNLKFKKTLVKQKTLDSFNFMPSLIKIDVEGYEKNVLHGAMKTIKKSKPILYVENNKRKFDTATYFQKQLLKHGYKAYTFNADSSCFDVYDVHKKKSRFYSYNVFFLPDKKVK